MPYSLRRLTSGSHGLSILSAGLFLTSLLLPGFSLRELGLGSTGKPITQGRCGPESSMLAPSLREWAGVPPVSLLTRGQRDVKEPSWQPAPCSVPACLCVTCKMYGGLCTSETLPCPFSTPHGLSLFALGVQSRTRGCWCQERRNQPCCQPRGITNSTQAPSAWCFPQKSWALNIAKVLWVSSGVRVGSRDVMRS